MSNSSWKKQLTLKLHNLVRRSDAGRPDRSLRLVVIGIGNELNGDDAAGVQVIRSLRRHLSERPDILVIEAGPAPENFTGPIRRFQPDFALLVDAVNMDAPVGTITIVEWEQISGISALTHRLPPTVFGKYLIEELHCPVSLLGIRAGSVEFDTQPSPVVKKSIRQAARDLVEILTRFPDL
jgi:hydrogenase 3 maturation protease